MERRWLTALALVLLSGLRLSGLLLSGLLLSGLLLSGCTQNHPLMSQSGISSGKNKISIAAASDLKFVFPELIEEFQRLYPEIMVQTTFGSSGNFFAQLSNRAPFDLFFSADHAYPRKLIDQGDAVQDSEFAYASGHLVLWVPNDSPLDLNHEGIQVLSDPRVKKIAMANPRLAPYGRAAEGALQHFGLEESLKDRIVLGDNVAQAALFVESGAADVGIVAASLASAAPMRSRGRSWQLPTESYPALQQIGVMMTWANDRSACERFREFVLSDAGQAILRQHGFAAAED